MKVDLLGLEITLIDKRGYLSAISDILKENAKYLIGYINVHGMNIWIEDQKFREFYDKCDLVTCDGFGIILGAKIAGEKINFSKRVTAPDYMDELLGILEEKNKKIYFLSSTQRVIDKTSEIVIKKFPSLRFEAHHGYFKKEGDENKEVLEKINSFNPDILYVGFGMPIQEEWILDNFDRIGDCIILPLGACLDFYSGEVYRGPEFLTSIGLEWLSRLFTEPKRLWKRYIFGIPLFVYRVFKWRLLK